ncbi:cyclic AMP-dependent transcription factor ATF-3-like [Ptychodera flava]|uniref:cyclic AMP-dependent transcription factor ATF-3-like n=1 Tax=Ptychodera flava TaxID=63121 RepID=UPI003969FC42
MNGIVNVEIPLHGSTMVSNQAIGLNPVAVSAQSSSPLTPLLKEEIKKSILSRRSVQELEELDQRREHSDSKQMTPEEEERRRARREKNRLAAAKCRDRQRERAESLFRETQKLESHNNELRNEIRKLAEEKSQLSFALNIHQLQSSVGNHPCKVLMSQGKQARPVGHHRTVHPAEKSSIPAAQGLLGHRSSHFVGFSQPTGIAREQS